MPLSFPHHAAPALGLVLVACASRLPSAQRPHLAIVSAVPYAEDSGVTPDIRACDLDEELLEALVDDVERHFQIALVTDARATAGRVLVMGFAQVEGTWGGAITGAKSVTVTGRLLESGAVVGSFTARWETSAMHAKIGKHYRSTCDLLELAAEEIAEDVAEWLLAPSQAPVSAISDRC